MAPELVFTIVSVVLVLAFGLFGGLWERQVVASNRAIVSRGPWRRAARPHCGRRVASVPPCSAVWQSGLRLCRPPGSLCRLGLFGSQSTSTVGANATTIARRRPTSGTTWSPTKEKPYNLEPFLNQHPGGRKILEDALNKPGRPSDVESLWKDNHVSWHQHNSRVQEIWKTL